MVLKGIFEENISTVTKDNFKWYWDRTASFIINFDSLYLPMLMLKHVLYKHLPQFIFKTCMKIVYVSLIMCLAICMCFCHLTKMTNNHIWKKQSTYKNYYNTLILNSIKLLRTHIMTKFFQLTIILIRQYMANIIQNSLWRFAWLHLLEQFPGYFTGSFISRHISWIHIIN